MQRRTLLWGASAFAMQTPETPTAMIGIGVRGSSLIQQVLKTAGAKVVAVCDIDPGARDRAASVAARDNPRGLR